MYMSIHDWNKTDICSSIQRITFACTDPRQDGYVGWGCKKELYEILWFVEDELAKCSTYVDEEEFVKKREQNKILKILGKQ
tara:strand:- start:1892 stop:2134 length:243 start_codon:yes stop_codon:yes gene_type:complete